MTSIYFIRHGDISLPKKNAYYGKSDFVLNDVGIMQANNIKKYFCDKKTDIIYSSHLKRAQKTTEIVFDENIIYSNDILERDFGIWEGLTYKEVKKKYPNQVALWEEDWQGYVIEDGESYKQFYCRVTAFFDHLLVDNKDKDIAIVTHGGIICCAISYLLGMEPKDIWRFKVDKASISKISINDSSYAYLDMLNLVF